MFEDDGDIFAKMSCPELFLGLGEPFKVENLRAIYEVDDYELSTILGASAEP